MRGLVHGLPSPHPLGETLPALYREDLFTQELCAGLDEVLAPVLSTLDNLPAYLDLTTAPDDMLPWLAHWVGMSLEADLPAQRQRELLRAAAGLQGWQGTVRGIQLAVEALFGVTAEIEESGGATWSTNPDAALPGDAAPAVLVRVRAEDGRPLEADRVDAVVGAMMPAHVPHRVQVV